MCLPELPCQRAPPVKAAAANPTSSSSTKSAKVDGKDKPFNTRSSGEETKRDDGTRNGDGDVSLGHCTLNLVNVASGRVPHMEEWVPLSSGGALKLSLDYDSAGAVPSPGDSVRSLSRSVGGICAAIGCLAALSMCIFSD